MEEPCGPWAAWDAFLEEVTSKLGTVAEGMSLVKRSRCVLQAGRPADTKVWGLAVAWQVLESEAGCGTWERLARRGWGHP